MAKGFDPKWSLVGALVYFEGPAGATVIVDEKTNGKVNLYNGAQISHLSPHFPNGVLWISDQAAPSKSGLALSLADVFLGADVCIENQFVATSWGIGGRRVLAHSQSIVIYLSPDDFSLHVGVKFDGTTWVDIGHVIADPEAFLGDKHDLRIRFSSARMSIELDGAEVSSFVHGVTSFVTAAQQFRFGNAYTTGTDQVFLGYIGQFRLTVGDLRAELSGEPIQRFEALGALDTYREKVVFHSHCEPTGGPIDDTCGNTVSFYGNAEISTGYKAFGSASFHPRTGGASVDFDAVLGAHDFEFEMFGLVLTNSANRGWCFALLDSGGAVVLGLTTKRDTGGSETVVIVNGVSHTVASGLSASMQYMSLVRAGNTMALFINGASVLSIDVTGVSIANVGPLYLGKPASVVETVTESIYLDETRLTLGQARHNVSATSIDVPTERFNEYGPHSMRGTVKRMVSGSAVISPGSLVAAFDRTTLRLVSRDVSAADGSFELPSAHGDEHFVLAFDDEMNLVGYDKILPAIFS